jgi:hypothetical protein
MEAHSRVLALGRSLLLFALDVTDGHHSGLPWSIWRVNARTTGGLSSHDPAVPPIPRSNIRGWSHSRRVGS